MTTRPFQFLCVHSHFHRPPRGNPITGDIGTELDAGTYRNWNERATVESYRPNAEIGNFDRISFDVGESLMFWLRDNAIETYQRIVQANQRHFQFKKVGNAMGSPFHHVILPLLKRRDKQTQLYWGRAAFKHHFKYEPQGIWLPEIGVDVDTLQAAEALGYRYTILAYGQVDPPVDNGGPFLVDLQNGRTMAVFIRNDELSNDLAFNISTVGGAGHWARNKLAGRRRGLLTLLATDGETFGQYHLGEERFLHWLLENEATAVGFRVVTLAEVLRSFPPTERITIKPFSSWSCFHGVSRWSTGCPCTPGYGAWKALLLRAFDNLSNAFDEMYLDVVRPLGIAPWQLRDKYIHVWLKEMSGEALLAEYASGLKSDTEGCILALLSAQMQMAQSYISNTFHHADFDRLEPRFAIANAIYALRLAFPAIGQETHDTITMRFKNDLQLVSSGITPLKGAHVYDSIIEEFWTPTPEISTDSAQTAADAASD